MDSLSNKKRSLEVSLPWIIEDEILDREDEYPLKRPKKDTPKIPYLTDAKSLLERYNIENLYDLLKTHFIINFLTSNSAVILVSHLKHVNVIIGKNVTVAKSHVFTIQCSKLTFIRSSVSYTLEHLERTITEHSKIYSQKYLRFQD